MATGNLELKLPPTDSAYAACARVPSVNAEPPAFEWSPVINSVPAPLYTASLMLTLEADWVGVLPVTIAVVEKRRILMHLRILWPSGFPRKELRGERWIHRKGIGLEAVTPSVLRSRMAALLLQKPDTVLVCHRACPLLDYVSGGSWFATPLAPRVWDAEHELFGGNCTSLKTMLKRHVPDVICLASSVLSRAFALQALHEAANTRPL